MNESLRIAIQAIQDEATQPLREEIERLWAENAQLAEDNEQLAEDNERLTDDRDHLRDRAGIKCGCGYDKKGDVCLCHFPAFAALTAERDRLAKRLDKLTPYIDHWWRCALNHGGAACDCGLDSITTLTSEEKRDEPK